ncbi:hypothetical protein [Roseateles amylovorans]|uniref:Uncharacterized protein n=1 Tax=Roseateles amylovorans TaxID=2978473 RepID=A0ABY6B0E3_9BURK|nr:hypothetical protein [Roseateles amylovorans]UXH78672.1 hypothetical protein N4261_01660 [Roseateles amylovorans]
MFFTDALTMSRRLSSCDQPEDLPPAHGASPKANQMSVDEAKHRISEFVRTWTHDANLARSVFTRTHGKDFASALVAWYSRLIQATTLMERRTQDGLATRPELFVSRLELLREGNRQILSQGHVNPEKAGKFLSARNAFFDQEDQQRHECVYHQPFWSYFRSLRLMLETCTDIDRGYQLLDQLQTLSRNAGHGLHEACARGIKEAAAARAAAGDALLADLLATLHSIQLE